MLKYTCRHRECAADKFAPTAWCSFFSVSCYFHVKAIGFLRINLPQVSSSSSGWCVCRIPERILNVLLWPSPLPVTVQDISHLHFLPNIIDTCPAELHLKDWTCSFKSVHVRRETCETTGHHTVAEGRGKFAPISVWDHCWIRQEFTRQEIWLANQKSKRWTKKTTLTPLWSPHRTCF